MKTKDTWKNKANKLTENIYDKILKHYQESFPAISKFIRLASEKNK